MYLNIVVNISSLFKQTEAFGIHRVSLRNIVWLSVVYETYTQFYTQKCKVGCFFLSYLHLILRKAEPKTRSFILKKQAGAANLIQN